MSLPGGKAGMTPSETKRGQRGAEAKAPRAECAQGVVEVSTPGVEIRIMSQFVYLNRRKSSLEMVSRSLTSRRPSQGKGEEGKRQQLWR